MGGTDSSRKRVKLSAPDENTESGENADEESIKIARKKRDIVRQRRHRQKRTLYSRCTGIAASAPEKYPPLDVRNKTVEKIINEDMQSLQENDCIARPLNWMEVIDPGRGERKFRFKHPWNNLRSSHYCAVATHEQLEQELKSGLPLPVLTARETALGQEVTNQCPWFGQPLEILLDEILKNRKDRISVQDHSKPSIGEFTVEKTCGDVRARFHMDSQDRGCAWNCLEIGDHLEGHKGPKCLENGAKLLEWQFTDPADTNAGRPQWSPVPGAKRLDRWLLASLAGSGSLSHIDVCMATWLVNMAGMKTIWVRNPTVTDRAVWKNFDVGDDHRVFEEPWARIDLPPGYILVFPPGTVHRVYTPVDSVFGGGHFLIPQVMDRFVDVLGQTELDPSKTNDLKGIDYFRILENFIKEALGSSTGLTKAQLHRFTLALKGYVALKFEAQGRSRDPDESEHMKRRRVFLVKLQRQGWISQLEENFERMSW